MTTNDQRLKGVRMDDKLTNDQKQPKMKYLLTTFLILLLSLTLSAQSLTWQKASPDYIIIASAGNGYMIMTNSRPASLELPQNPSDGDVVGFIDVSGTFNINSLTVDPGSIPIDGNRGIKEFTTQNISMTLVYSSSPYGWKTLTTNAPSQGVAAMNITPITQYGAVGDSTTDNTSAFNTALAAVDELFIPNGTFKISGTVSIPAGKKLVFANRGKIDVTGTLTGNHTIIDAGMFQIFTLTSDVQGTWNIESAFVEWFGAKSDGTGTYDMAAFQKTLEVFCIPTEQQQYIEHWNDTAYIQGMGVTVVATGKFYNIEKTLEFPQYGNLKLGLNTLLIAEDAMFETFVNITKEPFYIDGGEWLVRHYSTQSGYTGSNALEMSYNENPMFRFFMEREPTIGGRYLHNMYRFRSKFNNVTMSHVQQPGFTLSQPYLYDAIVATLDTAEIITNLFTYGKSYYIVDYQTGDDFTNIGGTNVTGNTFTATWDGAEKGDVLAATTWSNSSTVRKTGNASYFVEISDLVIYKADTGIYMQGDFNSGMLNSWKFNNISLDGCQGGAIVIGKRSAGHTFIGTSIQVSTSPAGVLPSVDINSFYNVFSGGVMWDVWLDSTVVLRKNAYHTEMGDWGRIGFAERYVKYVSTSEYKYMNNMIGSTPTMRRTISPANYGDWTLNGRSLKIFRDPDSLHRTGNHYPVSQTLDLISGRNMNYYPVMYIESQPHVNGTGSLDAWGSNAAYRAMLFTNRYVGSATTAAKGGSGTRLQFDIADYAGNSGPLGGLSFRQSTDIYLSTKPAGTFQVWLADDGVFTDVIRASHENKVTIKNILILEPLSAAPASPVEGSIYVNSSDNHIYIYLNSTWKQLDN